MKLLRVLSSCTENFACRLCSKKLIDLAADLSEASGKNNRNTDKAARGTLGSHQQRILVSGERQMQLLRQPEFLAGTIGETEIGNFFNPDRPRHFGAFAR